MDVVDALTKSRATPGREVPLSVWAQDAAAAVMPSPGLQETYPAIRSTVPQARQSLARFAADAGLEGERLDAVRLAVSEAVTNVVMHAYRQGDGEVHISAAADADALRVLVSDSGRGLRVRARNPGLGYGLKLMADACDDFDVVERAAGGTEVRLVFGLRAAGTVG